MQPYQAKTAFHTAMFVAALIEYKQADSTWRKLLCGAFVGFHGAAMLVDWRDKEAKF